MTVIKILVPVFILIFNHSVSCADDLGDARVGKQYVPIVRSSGRHTNSYKYNHPPQPDLSYESIPVAVVFEEDSHKENPSKVIADVGAKILLASNIKVEAETSGKFDETVSKAVEVSTESIAKVTTLKSEKENDVKVHPSSKQEATSDSSVKTKLLSSANDLKLEKDKNVDKIKNNVPKNNTSDHNSPKLEQKPLNLQKYPETEIHIPVIVVYEEPQTTTTKSSRRNVRRRLSRDRISGQRQNQSLRKLKDDSDSVHDLSVTTYRPTSVSLANNKDSDSNKTSLETTQQESLHDKNNEQSKQKPLNTSTSSGVNQENQNKKVKDKTQLTSQQINGSNKTSRGTIRHESSQHKKSEKSTPKPLTTKSPKDDNQENKKKEAKNETRSTSQQENNSNKTASSSIPQEPLNGKNIEKSTLGPQNKNKQVKDKTQSTSEQENDSSKTASSSTPQEPLNNKNIEKSTTGPQTTKTPKVESNRESRNKKVNGETRSTGRKSIADKVVNLINEDNSEGCRNATSRRQKEPVIPIIDSENKVFSHNGAFQYSYEGGDGTKAFSHGELKTFDEDKTGESVSGGFSYKDKDGTDISLTYTADENGYRPVGAHLPTPPPIPPAIARALAYLATKTTPAPVTEASNKKDKENAKQ